MMSKEQLLFEAREQQYKPEILEKVHHLLTTLEQVSHVPYLVNKLVLKGGTALNLFHFDSTPRLSVDIDLNYIGKLDRAEMLEEKPIISDALEKILVQKEYESYRNPGYHAGGKMVWRYDSVLGQKGNLEIDLNYMYRQPLWPIQSLVPKLVTNQSFKFPVLDIHELAAGKLSALMTRSASRDIFDAHHLFKQCNLDMNKLRLSFVAYISMTSMQPHKLQPGMINYEVNELRNRLLPVSKQNQIPTSPKSIRAWAEKITDELNNELNQILPFADNEMEFMQKIQKQGIVDASLLTNNAELQGIINSHPALIWAAKRAS